MPCTFPSVSLDLRRDGLSHPLDGAAGRAERPHLERHLAHELEHVAELEEVRAISTLSTTFGIPRAHNRGDASARARAEDRLK